MDRFELHDRLVDLKVLLSENALRSFCRLRPKEIPLWFPDWAWDLCCAMDRPEGWTNLFCRYRGHAGPVWQNINGLEPDMHCKNCGEDLG